VGPAATLHALPLPEIKTLLADYPACIVISSLSAMWPFSVEVENMLKQQYNIHL